MTHPASSGTITADGARPETTAAATPDWSKSAGWAGWFAVAIFCVAQIVSTIDRGMLALVVDPVRADLGITEMQIALLQGFAFATFYVTIGIPLGVLADTVNRRRLLIGGIIVWSVATICGGLAANFSQMFASRLFIGVGEAVLGPCAVTIIGDLFPPHRRGRPMAVYVFGSMVAYGVGSLVSGFILELAPTGAFDVIPWLRHRAPWRIAFMIVGSFGFVIAALLLFLREPRRHGRGEADPQGKSVRETIGHFIAGYRIFLPLYGALAMFAMGGSAASGWGAVLLTRRYGFDPAGAGKALGTAQIGWAVLGMILATLIVDRVMRRAGTAGKARLAAVFALAALPSCLAQWAGSGTLAVAMLAEVMFASAVYGTAMLSMITEITPVRARGLAVALYAFVMTMIGFSLGPIAVAFLTQHVFGSPLDVGKSIAIVGVVALSMSALLSLIVVERVRNLATG